jgi:hypothetical protein
MDFPIHCAKIRRPDCVSNVAPIGHGLPTTRRPILNLAKCHQYSLERLGAGQSNGDLWGQRLLYSVRESRRRALGRLLDTFRITL